MKLRLSAEIQTIHLIHSADRLPLQLNFCLAVHHYGFVADLRFLLVTFSDALAPFVPSENAMCHLILS